MAECLLADDLQVMHLVFIDFAVAGSLLVLRWPRLAWLHVPAAVWATLIALSGGICPLTEWETRLRREAGMAGCPEGFIGTLQIPLLYP
jgi:hypothetical protein